MPDKKSTTLKKLLMAFAGMIIIIIIIAVVRGKSSSPSLPATGLTTSSGTGTPLTAGIQSNTASSQVSEQTAVLVKLLQEVSTLKLNNDVFLNPVFGALVDISSPIIPDLNPGRINPFKTIGEDSGLINLGITPDTNNGVDALNTFLNTPPGN
jgi:hypothetical protein